MLLSPYNDMELGAGNVPTDEPEDLAFTFSQESLPHIPLRPFRNQVGGHSAIYKFTRRAVCKVCSFASSPSCNCLMCSVACV